MAEKPSKAAQEGNVDQIRDILFGGQMRDYERRFSELEERMRKDVEKLRSELNRRLEQIDSLVQDNHERHSAQLKKLELELRNAAELSEQRDQSNSKALRAELAATDDKHDKSDQVLRERLHKLALEFSDALRQRSEELASEFERQSAQLQDQKVARDEIAGFFTEMALRLTRQFELPGVKSGKA